MAPSVQEFRLLISTTKAWLAYHERHLQASKIPPELTEAQVNALKVLQLPVEPPEPDTGRENWVGKLMEHHQANSYFKPPSFREVSVLGHDGGLRWQCSVTTAMQKDPFPRPKDWEAVGHTSLPSFAKKKDAKQWASKCALTWISAQRLFGSGAKSRPEKESAKDHSLDKPDAADPIADPPLQMGATMTDDSNTESGGLPWWTYSSPTGRPLSVSKYSDQLRNDVKLPAHQAVANHGASMAVSEAVNMEQERPATLQVMDLCQKLNIAPPCYRITSSVASNPEWNLFDGFADWGVSALDIRPRKTRIIKEVLTKNACKEKVAEDALDMLKKENERRQQSNFR